MRVSTSLFYLRPGILSNYSEVVNYLTFVCSSNLDIYLTSAEVLCTRITESLGENGSKN